MWIIYALAAALFAGIMSILAKIGIRNIDSNLATALRTIVVAVFAWLVVLLVGSGPTLFDIDAKSLVFLVLSGFATGGSWLCYFRALQIGDVNKVVPVDKSSTVLTMLLSFLFLGDTFTLLKGVAMVLIGVGTYLMIERKEPAPDTAGGDEGGERGEGYKEDEGDEGGRGGEEDDGCKGYKGDEGGEEDEGYEGVEEDEGYKGDEGYEGVKGDEGGRGYKGYQWLVYAIMSAVFASLTAILAKVGIIGVESNLGTAIRTMVVLVMAWLIVFAQGKHRGMKRIDSRSWVFLGLSGLATGLSWLCFYRALQEGPASVVVPIDKLSILVTIVFGYFAFREKLTGKSALGLVMIVAGTMSLLIL